MNAKIERLSDGTIVITTTIPDADVKAVYEQVVADRVKVAELPGFRKGKAPKAVVEKKLNKADLYEEVVKRLIPSTYTRAIETEKLRPVINPKIELVDAQENSDWVVRFTVAEKPKVTVGDYKKAVADLKDAKRKKIWTPGQDKKDEEKKETKPTMDEIVPALMGAVAVTLPGILIDQEVNRLLSDLIDQTKRLGLSVEQYLASTGRTSESIRKEYENQAHRTITLELALEDIADKEGIFVSDADIDNVIASTKSDDEKKVLQRERYTIASILRRQKTLDFLASL